MHFLSVHFRRDEIWVAPSKRANADAIVIHMRGYAGLNYASTEGLNWSKPEPLDALAGLNTSTALHSRPIKQFYNDPLSLIYPNVVSFFNEMGIYGFYFLLLIFLFATMLIFRPGSVQRVGNAKFRRFQYEFLTAFLTMFAGDWLQGPTVYALYAYYGFSRTENGILFIVGFGSSMLLGPFTGALADRYGRRLICISYGIIYSLCCVTKHFNNFGLLLLGRLFGGVATSIVWSGFESWMVSEHRNRGFDDEWLGDTFSLMTVGNGIIAIPAGFIAQVGQGKVAAGGV